MANVWQVYLDGILLAAELLIMFQTKWRAVYLARYRSDRFTKFVDARHEIWATHGSVVAGRIRLEKLFGRFLALKIDKLTLKVLPAYGQWTDQRLVFEHLLLFQLAGRLSQLTNVSLTPIQLLFQRLPCKDYIRKWSEIPTALMSAREPIE